MFKSNVFTFVVDLQVHYLHYCFNYYYFCCFIKHIIIVNKTIISVKTHYYSPLTFQALPETFMRRSLFNSYSGSCHGRVVTWEKSVVHVAECVAALVRFTDC